jgi:hypothetical protein
MNRIGTTTLASLTILFVCIICLTNEIKATPINSIIDINRTIEVGSIEKIGKVSRVEEIGRIGAIQRADIVADRQIINTIVENIESVVITRVNIVDTRCDLIERSITEKNIESIDGGITNISGAIA